MTTQDHTISTGADLAGTDVGLARMLAGVPWLGEEDAHRVRQALTALMATICAHSCAGPGDLHISTTATSTRLTVIVEDAFATFRTTAGAGIGLVDQAFDEVTYARVLGRNRWILRRFAARPRRRSEGDRDRQLLHTTDDGQRELVSAAQGAQHGEQVAR